MVVVRREVKNRQGYVQGYLPLLAGYYYGLSIDKQDKFQDSENLDGFSFSLGDLDKEERIDKSKDKKGIILALVWCAVDVVFFCISFISIQYLEGAIEENEVNSWRYFFSFLMAAPLLIRTGDSRLVPKSKWPLFAMACVVSVANQSLLYSAAVYLPAGTTYAISSSTAIICTAILVPILRRECNPKLLIGAAFSIVGIVLVIQPQFLRFPFVPPARNATFNSPCRSDALWNETEKFKDWTTLTKTEFGNICSVCSGIFIALDLTIQHSFVKDCNPFTLTTWKAVVCCLSSLVLMLIFETPTFPSVLTCGVSLIAHAVGASVRSNVAPYCLQYLSANSVNLMRSLSLIALVVLQYTLMRNVLPAKENWMEVLGVLLCMAGCIGGTLYEVVKQLRHRESISVQALEYDSDE